MAVSRYAGRRIFFNDDEAYDNMFRRRGVKHIRHYASPELRYPTPAEIRTLSIEKHVWSQGDRYYKLAHEHYGSAKLWGVIAWFNQKPTEGHVKLGDVIEIPKPIDLALEYFGV